MSFEAIAAVRKLHEHTQVVPREQLILYVLAGYADMNWESWPSQGRIGDETGFSRQTVNKILGNLEAKGLVKSDHRMRRDGGQSSKLYKLVLPTVIVADPESTELSTGLHPLSTRGDRGLSTRGDTKVSIERKTKDLPPLPPQRGAVDKSKKSQEPEAKNQELSKKVKEPETKSQEPEAKQFKTSRKPTAGVSQGRRRKRQTSNRESFRRPAWDVSGGDRQNINHPDYRLVRGQKVPAGFRRRPTEHEMEAEVLPDKPPGYGWDTLEKRGKAEAQAAQVARRQKHAPIHERGLGPN